MAQKKLEPKVRTTKRNERKRFLNVIYFVDSNRTRTLKFSIRGAITTISCLVVMLARFRGASDARRAVRQR
ncbi:MAG: hypothetical protein ACOVS5_03635, partial [Oligoflexus sp.]